MPVTVNPNVPPHARSGASGHPFYASAGVDPYLDLFQGPGSQSRVAGVRRALDQALDAWWQNGAMPGRGLLRDGLMVLKAGHDLNDAACTLLLRTALFYGRGMLTALEYQPDPARTASVLRDMLLHPRQPMNPAQIVDLRRQDPDSPEWMQPLQDLLRQEAGQLLEPRRTLAAAALVYFEKQEQEEKAGASTAEPAWTPISKQVPRAKPGRSRSRRRSLLAVMLGLLSAVLFVTALALFWQSWTTADLTDSMRTIPSGVYRISAEAAGGPDRLVEVEAFAMDSTEVTNRDYRRCFDTNACTWPERVTSIQRPDYFLNPNMAGHPMVNVTRGQAAAYCRWTGKRLPLAEEWEIAAASALTLQERYTYPWGDVYESGHANDARTGSGDTLPPGTYSPAGNSPAGLIDMAGNVAEWTATARDDPETAAVDYVVKGGSFLSTPEDLQPAAYQLVPEDEYRPTLGFRCTLTLPTD